MESTLFSSNQLEAALGVTNRELSYCVEREYIDADIKRDRPRVFSARQAIYLGLIRFFNKEGLSLERAARIGRLTGWAGLEILKRDNPAAETEIRLFIRDSLNGIVMWNMSTPEQKGKFGVAGLFYFLTTMQPEQSELGRFLPGQPARSIWEYNLGSIIEEIQDKLGISKELFTVMPKDARVSMVPLPGESVPSFAIGFAKESMEFRVVNI